MSENIKRCVDCFHYNACKDWVDGWVGPRLVHFPYEANTEDDLCEYYNAGATIIPIKLNQIVYKICPKCNDNHHGSCRNCAWQNCLGYGCEVGVGVWHDGSYNTGPLQLVPVRVVERNFITILKSWNVMYFPTEKAAGVALTEYDAIRGIEEKEERYNAFSEWAAAREVRFSFLEG